MARLVLMSGKGGVGKTTVSAGTAIHLAENQGLRVLVASSDPAHSLSDSFGQTIRSEPTPIEGVPNLWAVEVSAEKEMASLAPYIRKKLQKDWQGLGVDDLVDEDATLPGVDEAVVFMKVLQYILDVDYDIIIFDTAPTGHTIRLLEMARKLDNWVVKFVRFKNKVRGLLKAFVGDKVEEDPIAKMRRMAIQIRDVLKDENLTELITVLIPEQMSIAESQRAFDRIRGIVRCRYVVVNHVIASHRCNCQHCDGRQRGQKDARRTVDDVFGKDSTRKCSIVYVNESAGEVNGLARLRVIGETLFETSTRAKLRLDTVKPVLIQRNSKEVRVNLLFPYVGDQKDIRVYAHEGKFMVQYFHVKNEVAPPPGFTGKPRVEYDKGYVVLHFPLNG